MIYVALARDVMDKELQENALSCGAASAAVAIRTLPTQGDCGRRYVPSIVVKVAGFVYRGGATSAYADSGSPCPAPLAAL
jgi:hypothetical protein